MTFHVPWPFPVAAGILATLKLTAVLTGLSWLWVFAPLWGIFALLFVLLLAKLIL